MKHKQRKQRKHLKKRNHQNYKEKPAQENDEFQDTFKINQALRTENYSLLREIGRETGFTSDAIRRRVWPFLLHCTDLDQDNVIEGSLDVPHKDEDQVNLDVIRSFNSFPKNLDEDGKEKLQKQLKNVIVHVLRSYPSLHYYQGFHDICSVFILLFDEMYVTMEPVLKQLTILDTIIRLEDLELYDFITEAGVLPYYCLSWVITWCSHDLEDLDRITRLFDLFLCSNPFMVVYFAAAVVLSRRDQVLALPCETSTIHSFLTKLPKDIDVDSLCQTACGLEETYSVFEIQCQSTIALDEVSAINRFERDWLPMKSLQSLNDTIEDHIIPILQDKDERKPIELVSTASNKQHVHQSKSILQKLQQLDKKDAFLYTLLTVGAGVSLVAMFMSNSDLIRYG
ncbi:TBC1 domain family member 20-like [Mucor ambiguus]|uniref:TBC1 domain family member 20-like n=1 Tax=Mucor ambiguus TaxID=91626 RepID=A0A0C9N0N5_9FUNG|nr:TBC1 domain family member 20-like [Mucor ambiguus]